MLAVGLLCLLVYSVGSGNTHNIDDTVGKFIVNVTASLYASSSFTAFLCTNTVNMAKLSRQMSENHVLHDLKNLSTDYQFYHVDSTAAHQNFYILDLDCQGSEDLLSKADASGMFIAPTKWLILQDLRFFNNSEGSVEDNGMKWKNIFANLSVFPDSEIIIGQRIDNNQIIMLSVYRPNSVRSLIVEDRGVWNDVDKIQLYKHDVSSRRRTNLQETQLKAVVVLSDAASINHLEDFEEKSIDVGSKTSFMLSKLLVARMNANFTFVVTSSWGYQSKNGTWNGLVGYLRRNEVDFGATVSFITSPRVGIVHYIQLYTPDRIRFVFRRPALSYVSNLFTLPFTRTVWIAVTIICCFGFGTLYLSMKWEWVNVKNVPHTEKLGGDLETNPTMADNFVILVGAITQQGSSYEPRTIAARVVILMLLVLCLSLYAAYTANIVALLQSSSDSIKTLQDLMNSPLKIGLLDIAYNHYYFGIFEDPVRKEFYERRIKNQDNLWMDVDEGAENLRHKLFAFHTETTLAYEVIQSTYGEDEKCGFQEIDYLYVSDPALTIKRQSPYQEIFRVGALWIEETGLRQRYTNIMYVKKPVCSNQKRFISAGIIECYAAYLTIGYGMAITLGILILEIIWSKSFNVIKTEVTDVETLNTESIENLSIVGKNIEDDFVD